MITFGDIIARIVLANYLGRTCLRAHFMCDNSFNNDTARKGVEAIYNTLWKF
jgi:hypothetical protein